MLIFSDIALSMGQILNVSAWFCEKTEQFLHQRFGLRVGYKNRGKIWKPNDCFYIERWTDTWAFDKYFIGG